MVHSGRKLRLTARVRRNYFCHSQAAKCSINLQYSLKLPSLNNDEKVFKNCLPSIMMRRCLMNTILCDSICTWPGTAPHIFSSGSSPATRCHPSSCWTSKSPSWWDLFLQLGNSGVETFSIQRRVAVCQIRRSCIKRITHCCGKLQHIFYRTRVRSLALLVTHWLTNSLPFSKLDWCDPGVWRCLLKTCWGCYCCWC